MTDTTHLVMFLQARLTEDEANAKRAGGDRWIQDGGSIHRERHETAHVLADIAAKRRIIEWHSDNPHECEDHPDYRKEWAAKPTSIHPLARPTDGNTT